MISTNFIVVVLHNALNLLSSSQLQANCIFDSDMKKSKLKYANIDVISMMMVIQI